MEEDHTFLMTSLKPLNPEVPEGRKSLGHWSFMFKFSFLLMLLGGVFLTLETESVLSKQDSPVRRMRLVIATVHGAVSYIVFIYSYNNH